MANFEQVIKWFREGKKVRRSCWLEDSYWKLGRDERICWKNGATAHIHLNQINGNDWEIFEEDSDIKLKAKKIVDELAKSLENVIKKTLEKLKNA